MKKSADIEAPVAGPGATDAPSGTGGLTLPFGARLPVLSMSGFAVGAAIVLALDQITKAWAIRSLGDGSLVVVPGLLRFVHRTNTGAAFSIFRDHPEYLAIFASCMALGLIGWALWLKAEERALRWALAPIVGGAVGNLIDRFRLGHVTDFIDVHWNYGAHFPTFNVADSGITVGMILLILLNLANPPRK